MSEIWLIRSTFPGKDEAISVAQTLLEEHLVACVNIDEQTTAMFRWENMIQREQEVVLLAKTTKLNVNQTISRIKMLHSYQIPSILAWPAPAAEDTFLGWVKAEVQ